MTLAPVGVAKSIRNAACISFTCVIHNHTELIMSILKKSANLKMIVRASPLDFEVIEKTRPKYL